MKKRFFALFLTMALLLPAVLLVVWIIRGASLMRAGMIGIFACIACNVIRRRQQPACRDLEDGFRLGRW